MNTPQTPALPHIDHPILVLVRGIPGSGKSYLARALQRAIGEERMVILDPDTIDLTSQAYLDFSAALTKDGVDQKFHPYRWSRAKAYDSILAGKIVLWSQAFTNLDGFNKTIVNLQGYAEEHGLTLPLLVVEVEAPHEVAKRRVAEREQQGGHGVPDEAFERFIREYRSFTEEGFTVISIKGDDDIGASVAAVIEGLKEL